MKKWYEYLWIVSITYLILGIFNILFGLIGIICFITPLFIAIFQHDKAYCNKYCGRSRLFDIFSSINNGVLLFKNSCTLLSIY